MGCCHKEKEKRSAAAGLPATHKDWRHTDFPYWVVAVAAVDRCWRECYYGKNENDPKPPTANPSEEEIPTDRTAAAAVKNGMVPPQGGICFG